MSFAARAFGYEAGKVSIAMLSMHSECEVYFISYNKATNGSAKVSQCMY